MTNNLVPEFVPTIQKSIETVFDAYLTLVEHLAMELFASVVRPWLEENEYELTQIMGDWLLEYKDEVHLRTIEFNIPEPVRSALYMKVPGAPQADMGMYMPSYNGATKLFTGHWEDMNEKENVE